MMFARYNIRWNNVHCHLKLLVVKCLGLGVTVRVRVKVREWIFHSFFSIS